MRAAVAETATSSARQDGPKPAERKAYVDGLRGLAMLLVIVGHMNPHWTEFFVVTSPVKIPLFFVISGFLFRADTREAKPFFSNLFWHIVLPWFFLSLYPLRLLRALVAFDLSAALKCTYRFVSGADMWYMPCFIVAETIYYFVSRQTHSHPIHALVCLAIAAGGLVLSNYEVFSFMQFSNACTAQSFLLLGSEFRLFKEGILDGSPARSRAFCIAGIAAYVLLVTASFAWYPGKLMDVHLGSYYSIPLCFALIAVGCPTLFVLFEALYRGSALAFVGKNTLVFYMLQYPVRTVFWKVLKKLGLASWLPQAVQRMLGVAAVLAACTVFALLINRFCPILNGRGRKRD